MRRAPVTLRIGWLCLLVVGIAIVGFGLIAVVVSSDALGRANGLALTGLGLFGTLLSVVPFRRRERWAWLALWFYPVFWTAHLVGGLPPGKDHVHQVVFIVMSLTGLLLPSTEFWQPKPASEQQAPL